MVITHSKVTMMSESTNMFTKKLGEENEGY